MTALVLAGGQGQRMQGQDKGLVELKGVPLVEYALDCVSPLAAEVMISCNRNTEAYQRYGVALLEDESKWAFKGPMAGIQQALNHISTDWLLVMPCDTPLMTTDVMAELLQPTDALAHIFSHQGLQPLHGLYHKSLLADFEACLSQQRYGLQAFLRTLNTLKVTPYQGARACFNNANSPAELHQIEHLLGVVER